MELIFENDNLLNFQLYQTLYQNLKMKLAKPPLKLNTAGAGANPRRITTGTKNKVKLSRSKENSRAGPYSSSVPRAAGGIGVRTSSANGPVGIKHKMQILPDPTTTKLGNLKRVKFLDPEFEAPVKIDAKTMQAEYMKRKDNLDKSLQRVIDKTKVAHMQVLKKSAKQIQDEKKAHVEELENNPLAKLMESAKPKESGPKEEDKFADGFIRSKRNTQLRVKQELLSQIQTIEEEKTALIQKMNKALIKLDQSNQNKRELGDKLLEQVKFVRDLQAAAANGDDIEGVVSTQLKVDFQREKELNFRLSEELQRCEKERLRLLERIQLLSGEKQIEIGNTDGIKRTFKVTQVSINRILDELRERKGTVASNQELVDQSRAMCMAVEAEMTARERDIHNIKHESDDLVQKYNQLENKYRDTVYLNEGARDRMGGMHRMHIKLLATRQMEESLHKVFNRSKKESIDQMLFVTRGYINQFGAIYRLRNLLIHQNQRKAKNALARWFKLACDPLMLLEQNRQIPEFFAKRHTEKLVFNREFEAWMLNQGLEAQQKSQVDVMRGRLHNFWRRELKLRFNMWKDNATAKRQNLKVIDRAIRKMMYFDVSKAFIKWTTFVKEQDFNTRMHGMAVMTAQRQTQTSIFYAWKTWAHVQKKERQALKRRCLRGLRVAVQKRKHLQKMALSALGFEIQSKRSILKQCWDALRQNKEQEKYQYIHDRLNSETTPACEMLRSNIGQIQDQEALQQKKRSMKAFMTLFGRQLSQYFNHWKNSAIKKKTKTNGEFKQRLIKLYRSKIEKAFNMWRVNRSAMIIDMKVMEFEGIQMQNQEIEVASKKKALKIKAADRSCKSMGAKHIRKLVLNAYQRNMKAYLDRWRKKNGHINNQVDTSQRILQKMRARFLRMAWNRYRYGVRLADQDDKNNVRVDEVKIRLDFRQKKRTYLAIKSYARKSRTAKRFLKTLINGIEKANKDTAYRRWKDYNHGETIMKFEEQQTEMIGQMVELEKLDGNTANKLKKKADKCARLTKSLKTQSQKTLQKYAYRLINQTVSSAFQTWKQTEKNLTHREGLVKSIRRHMIKNSLRQALVRWKQACGMATIQMTMENISMENDQIDQGKLVVQKHMEQRRKQADKNSIAMKDVDLEHQKLAKKTSNTIARLINTNQTHFFTSKLNHVFFGWKAYMDRRKRCCEILSNALRKTALQKTFTHINNFSRDKHHKGRQEQSAGKSLRTYQKFRLKAAMTKWRETEYQNVVMLQMETTTEMNSMIEAHSVKRANVKKHHAAVKSARSNQRTLKDWFVGWQIYASEERDTKMRTKHLQQALHARAVAKALRKWNLRTQKTQQMRAFLKRGKFIKKNLNMKSAFTAWRQENKIERAFTNKIHTFMENVRNLNCQSAFDLIKRYATERNTRNGKNKTKGQKVLMRAFANFNEGKLRQSFNKMRQWKDKVNTRDHKMRTALANMSSARTRSYFMTWKDKAHQVAIHAQNEEEDGPTNLEAWQLRQDNFNLIRLMKEDGLTNSQIHKIHQDGEQKYKVGVEKSLCRILCKQTDGLGLLPACLEQWKKYAKIRKIWRRVIKDAEIKTIHGDEMSRKLWAFRRLQYTHDDRQKTLWGRPIAGLRTHCVNNVEKLDKLADMVENAENNDNELRDQRNLLIKGQVGGQKLALSLSVQNQDRTKMHALSKFHEFGTKRLQSKIAQVIQANLDRIGDLKSTISKFENDNDELARQNDEFRSGAMDGITMVRHVENLTADRDKLSIDLADKALTIRKLLEDNQYLQNKLTNARAQTNVILDVAKKEAIMRQNSKGSLQDIPARDRSGSPLRDRSRSRGENEQRRINGMV